MEAGKLKIIVDKAQQQIYFDRGPGVTLLSGGDENETDVNLTYHNGLGYSFTTGEILYQEGNPGNTFDFFQIRCKTGQVCTQDGTLECIVRIQTMNPPGNYSYAPTIAGSPPFVFVVDLT